MAKPDAEALSDLVNAVQSLAHISTELERQIAETGEIAVRYVEAVQRVVRATRQLQPPKRRR